MQVQEIAMVVINVVVALSEHNYKYHTIIRNRMELSVC